MPNCFEVHCISINGEWEIFNLWNIETPDSKNGRKWEQEIGIKYHGLADKYGNFRHHTIEKKSLHYSDRNKYFFLIDINFDRRKLKDSGYTKQVFNYFVDKILSYDRDKKLKKILQLSCK